MRNKSYLLPIMCLVISKFTLACFTADADALEERSRDAIARYRSIVESLLHVTSDHVNFLKERSLPKNNTSTSLHLSPYEQSMAASIFGGNAKPAQSVVADFAQLSKILDAVVLYRMSESVDATRLIHALKEITKAADSLSNKHLCSAFKALAQIDSHREQYKTLGYPNAYIDIAISQFLLSIAVAHDEEVTRYISQSIFQSDFDRRTAFTLERYLDEAFRTSGFLQMQTLLQDLRADVREHLRYLKVMTKFTMPSADGSSHEKNRTKSKNRRRKAKRTTTTRVISCPQILTDDVNEEEKEASPSLPLNPEPETPIFSSNEEHIEQEHDHVLQEFAPAYETRWWLGYELEKKIARKNAKQNRHQHHHGDTKPYVEMNEVETIDAILEKYKSIPKINLLTQLLKPGKNKLKSMHWGSEVAPLLGNVRAIVDSTAAGSRHYVSINGVKTTFHTHGSIGIDTINSHLRNFLIQSLGKEIKTNENF